MARTHLSQSLKWDGGPGAKALILEKDSWAALRDPSVLKYKSDNGRALLRDAEREGGVWDGSLPATPRRPWLVSMQPMVNEERSRSSSTVSTTWSAATTCPSARPSSALSQGRFSGRPTHRKFKVWSGPCTPRSAAATISSAREAIDARRPASRMQSTSTPRPGTSPAGTAATAVLEGARGATQSPTPIAVAAAPLQGSAKSPPGAAAVKRSMVTPRSLTPTAPVPRRSPAPTPTLVDTAESRRSASPRPGGGDVEWLTQLELPNRQRIADYEAGLSRTPGTPPTSPPLGPSRAGAQANEEEADGEAAVEVPLFDMQRPAGRLGVRDCRPSYDLWVSLQGGNGRAQQRRAFEEWEKQIVYHQDSVKAFEEVERRKRAARAEALRRKRIEEAALRKRVEEAEREAVRKKEIERQQRQKEKEEEEARRLAEERRQELLKPRACEACSGSGHCDCCAGTGCTMTLILTENIDDGTDGSLPVHLRGTERRPRGMLPSGCKVCGGAGDEFWGTFEEGDGVCRYCCGGGKLAAPPGGWPS